MQGGGQGFLFFGERGQTLAMIVAVGSLSGFLGAQTLQCLATFANFRLEAGEQGAGWRIASRIGMFRCATDRAGNVGFQTGSQGLDILSAGDFGGFQRLFRLFQPGRSGGLISEKLS